MERKSPKGKRNAGVEMPPTVGGTEVGPKAKSRKLKASKSQEARVKNQDLEGTNSAPDSHRDNIPNSAINKSETAQPSLTPIKNKQRLKIEHPKSEIQMEVHHHPDLHHQPKAWKEYVLEGLMIFLAVMMGFFAESIRENISDNEHVAQLCGQLIQDMKTDTINLNTAISKETAYMKADDNLFAVLQQPLEKMDTKKFQQLVSDCFYYHLFHPSTGAIGAIKSELRLKQFSNTQIADYIANYEGDVEVIKKVEDVEDTLVKNIEEFMRAHFTMVNVEAILNSKNNQAINGQLRNIAQNDLDQLGVDIQLLKTIRHNGIEAKNHLKQRAVKLMQFVKNQYDLKDE